MHRSKWWKNKRIRKNIAKCVNKNSLYGIMEKKKGVQNNDKNRWKPWGCIYIYIYIVRFNKIKLCEHREKAMCFRRT